MLAAPFFFGCNLESFCFLYKCRNAHTCKCVHSTERIFAACDSACLVIVLHCVGDETMQFTVRSKCMQCISIGFARCNGLYSAKKCVANMSTKPSVGNMSRLRPKRRERERSRKREYEANNDKMHRKMTTAMISEWRMSLQCEWRTTRPQRQFATLGR